MSVAILTKYLGPTNHRGSRVKAYTESGLKITVSWDHALNVEMNHRAAAHALANKMGWHGNWAGGAIEHGYAYVNASAAWDSRFHIRKEKDGA